MIKNHRTDFVGQIYDTKNFGKVEILQEMIPIGYSKNQRLFKIRFLNTGYTMVTSLSNVPFARDRYAITVRGVGYLGDYDYMMQYDPLYNHYAKIWDAMIDRCYNPNHKSYHQYGGIGVRISDKWKCFRNFYYDVKTIPCYDKHILYPTEYQLDKDFLQRHIPDSNRVYSKETCVWASKYENNLLRNVFDGVKYCGVQYDSGYYYTKIYYKYYGRFKEMNDAAMLFNYIYPIIKVPEFSDLPIQNNVPYKSFNELMDLNLLLNRKDLNPILNQLISLYSSTTIPDECKGVDLK